MILAIYLSEICMNFNKIALVSGLVVSGIAVSSVFLPANANSFQNTFGLSDPHSTITFGLQDYPDITSITNQYINQGIVFSPNVFYFSNNPRLILPSEPPFFINALITNYIPFETIPSGSVVISFTQTQTEVAFALGTQSNATTFQAFLGTNLIDSFTANTTYLSLNNFFGFSGITFDSIKITVSNNNAIASTFGLDNIQIPITSSVPEPLNILGATAGLALFGTVSSALKRRKLSK